MWILTFLVASPAFAEHTQTYWRCKQKCGLTSSTSDWASATTASKYDALEALEASCVEGRQMQLQGDYQCEELAHRDDDEKFARCEVGQGSGCVSWYSCAIFDGRFSIGTSVFDSYSYDVEVFGETCAGGSSFERADRCAERAISYEMSEVHHVSSPDKYRCWFLYHGIY